MVVFDRLWSGRAVTEHKYVFLFFVCVYMYVSNHFNHCIKLFADRALRNVFCIATLSIVIYVDNRGGSRGTRIRKFEKIRFFNQDNVSEWSDMYIRGLLFPLANTMKKI
jgi:hypothetical protein